MYVFPSAFSSWGPITHWVLVKGFQGFKAAKMVENWIDMREGWANGKTTFDYHCKSMKIWERVKKLVLCSGYNAPVINPHIPIYDGLSILTFPFMMGYRSLHSHLRWIIDPYIPIYNGLVIDPYIPIHDGVSILTFQFTLNYWSLHSHLRREPHLWCNG
jgi:hypothetical protein